MKVRHVLIPLMLCFNYGHAQLNVELLHQLIAESKSEHSRQISSRDNQALASSAELTNRNQTAAFKDNFRKIQSRFHTLGMAIDIGQISIEALPVLEEISRQQQSIFRLCMAKPALMLIAINAQDDLLDGAHSLVNYLYGLTLEAGVLARMKPSDRKLLFGEALSQLKGISGMGAGLESTLINASRKWVTGGPSPFGGFLNEDRRIIENIIKHIKK